MWKRIGSVLRFGFNNTGVLGLDSTCLAIGDYSEYLCCVLNSPMGHYMLQNAPKTGTGDLLISVQAVEPIKIPKISKEENCTFSSLLEAFKENEINHRIFELYKLSQEEREYIINNF